MRELTYERPVRRGKKPGPTARARAKRRRAEAPVAQTVRAACVERDGICRYWKDAFAACFIDLDCTGPSEWAHLGEKKRARTRGQAPEIRHTTAGSLMLCRQHHDQYDGRQKPRLFVTALTAKGADGPLRFRRSR